MINTIVTIIGIIIATLLFVYRPAVNTPVVCIEVPLASMDEALDFSLKFGYGAVVWE